MNKLSTLLQQIDQLKAEIDSYRPLNTHQEGRIWQKLRLEWNYHSNAIEGNSLTLGETHTFLLYGITAKGKPFKDYLDIRGHDQAIQFLQQFVRQNMDLSEAHLRELHKILLGEPHQISAQTADGQANKVWVRPGEYKTEPNMVYTATGTPLYFSAPEEVPLKIRELVGWYRAEMSQPTLHPVLMAAQFHYRFVQIHPFADGNGRMARLLMNLILMQTGYVPVIIKNETKNEEYYPALAQANVGEMTSFFELIAQELKRSLEIYVRGAKGENIDELDDLDKQIQLIQQQLSSKQQKKEENIQDIVEIQKQWINLFLRPFLENLYKQSEKIASLFENWRLIMDYSTVLQNLIIQKDNLDRTTNYLNEQLPLTQLSFKITFEQLLKNKFPFPFICEIKFSLPLTLTGASIQIFIVTSNENLSFRKTQTHVIYYGETKNIENLIKNITDDLMLAIKNYINKK